MAASASTSTMVASAPNIDGMLLLEAPFARAPHDELRRQLRSQQRLVERDLTACSSTLASLSRSSQQSDVKMDDKTQIVDAAAETSFTGDISFMTDGGRADESMMTVGDVDEDGEGDTSKAKSSDLEKSLDFMLGRLKGLKRKLTSVHESTQSTLIQLEARSNHLDQLQQIEKTSSPAFDEWCRTRLDRMLVDWMLRKGYGESARTLAKSRRIENYVDLELFAEISRVEASLTQTTLADGTVAGPSCAPTLAWCSENKAALRKIRSSLEFDLRLQEFIELTRARTPKSLLDAIAYCRKHLLPLLSGGPKSNIGSASSSTANDKEEREEREQYESIRGQINRAMGLLACGPGGWAYEDLYNVNRWQALQSTFRACALQIHSLPPQPILHVALSAGLSSLKLPACTDGGDAANQAPAHLGGKAFGDERSNLLQATGYANTSVPASTLTTTMSPRPPASTTATTNAPSRRSAGHPYQTKNENCPVCDETGLGILAREVPWSHHANSTLVCYITGKIMNENNPPMVLPNGCVYSRAALEELALSSKDGASVICPRTGESFSLSSLRKVYIS